MLCINKYIHSVLEYILNQTASVIPHGSNIRQMWMISNLANFRPRGISFHALVIFGLGKHLLFQSVTQTFLFF